MEAGGGSDIRDILDINNEPTPMTKENLLRSKKPLKKADGIQFKRPEGMHRELWGLIWTDNKDAPPIIPTDTNQGYKQMKAKIGRSRVRPWKWMSFTVPSRKDGAIFHHWRRIADEGKDYPFARFNKSVDVPTYSDAEYQQHLHDDSWSRAETDHLFEMAKRFDLRFIVMYDRWNKDKFPNRSVEDLKERYYHIQNTLVKARAPVGTDPKVRVYDGDHERRRKDQLNKLFIRTTEQVEEEQMLVAELKKIELRKKEREKKTQDLQKLITAADTNAESRRIERKTTKKKILPQTKNLIGNINPDTTGIKFPDFKTSGVTLRSQRMKLPGSVGQKKTKAIEQVLEEIGLEFNPIPTEEIVTSFNELRQDIVLLYELKLALANCEYELQTLRHQFETLAPGKLESLNLGSILIPSTIGASSITTTPEKQESQGEDVPIKTEKKFSETIDVVSTPTTPNKKRRAALEQSNILKKIKGIKS
ncbi:unnamed protein product [Owenia fusiformis]|uniref:DNA methyltransferase 1-associated protein 1 n=1 Tax=Owenia fusiformis TaxID=6347 RepID=A0A8J1YBF2_OWEFU|nr:unnamed protein product [Owenia fusiformis]